MLVTDRHPRRLQLLHQLDPDGTREIVKQALDNGSKEVKVVAIECLGADPGDLSYLLEQAAAKAQEVRQAAYRALSAIDEDAAVAVLQKALNGKDLDLAAESLRRSKNAKLLQSVISAAEEELAGLPKTKDKKEVGKKVNRIQVLIGCLHGRDDKESEACLLNLFGQRDDLAKIKGDTVSGSDLTSTVVRVMQHGTPKVREALAAAHAALRGEDLEPSFRAARHVLSAGEVFEMFSPYLTAKVDNKKKQRDVAWVKRQAICEALGGHSSHYASRHEDKEPSLDPRWLDVAVEQQHLGLVRQLARSGHAGANAFLKDTFATVLKGSKTLHDCHEIVSCMVFAAHPEATDALIAAFEKHAKTADYYAYWFGHLIRELPSSALPKLEALVPKLSDKAADNLLGHIQQLREKK